MKITSVEVVAGRTSPHPFMSYANLRWSVRLTASIADDESTESVVKDLQAKSEGLVDEHMKSLAKAIIEQENTSRREREIDDMEKRLRHLQEDLERARGRATVVADSYRVRRRSGWG